MTERILILRQQNDELFKKICRQLDQIQNRVDSINDKLYEDSIRNMTDRELGFEFSDRCIDCLDEFKSMMYHEGREYVENYLIDKYSASRV